MNNLNGDLKNGRRRILCYRSTGSILLLVAAIVLAVFLIAYIIGNGFINLPNGFSLNKEWGTVAILRNASGDAVTTIPINYFMVQDEYVYGAIDENYFVLNTKNGKFKIFNKWKSLLGYAENSDIKTFPIKIGLRTGISKLATKPQPGVHRKNEEQKMI